MKDYDRLYVLFIYYFNKERDYFECHEVLEELWLEEGRNPYYQGLLQVAVGLYHHRNNNVSGSEKLFAAAIQKLEGYDEIIHGIHLGKLLDQSREYINKLRRFETEPFSFYDLDIEIIDPILKELVDEVIIEPPTRHE